MTLTRSSAFAALANLGYTSDIIIIIIIVIIIRHQVRRGIVSVDDGDVSSDGGDVTCH